MGRSLEDFDIAPAVNVYVTDDLAAARDAMRPFIALYVGGMGSREQNFYNQLAQRYGYADAAKEIQDLYLDGKRDEAMAAIPDSFIDMVSICGPPDVVRERLAVYRDAGVGTLGVTPWAFTGRGAPEPAPPGRRARRLSGGPAGARRASVQPEADAAGRLRRPRPRLPDDRARPRADRARPRGDAADLAALAGERRGRGHGVRAGTRVQGLSVRPRAAGLLRGGRAGDYRHAPAGARAAPGRRGLGHPHARAGARRASSRDTAAPR